MLMVRLSRTVTTGPFVRDRAEEPRRGIGRTASRAARRAELPIDCEDASTLRAVLVGMLWETGLKPLPASTARGPDGSRSPVASADTFRVSHTAITIHPPSRCEGYRCPWHNPSDHGMVGWPRDILTDRHNLLVRVCADGIGHPDPDSLEWLHRIGVADDGDHACDGCCQEAHALCRRGRLLTR